MECIHFVESMFFITFIKSIRYIEIILYICSGERIFFESEPEFAVSWNNLLGELTYLYKYFNITFDLLINKLTGGSFQSIIHFSTGGFDDAHEQYGDRCPAVWLKFDDDRFKLFVESAISGERKMNRKINKKQLKEGEWMKIEISQTMDKENKVRKKFIKSKSK